jgi:hypothetical protein
MAKPARSKAEEQFAVAEKRAAQALADREKARQDEAKHVAKLRALRLAKQAADKEAANATYAAKAAAKTKRPSR